MRQLLRGRELVMRAHGHKPQVTDPFEARRNTMAGVTNDEISSTLWFSISHMSLNPISPTFLQLQEAPSAYLMDLVTKCPGSSIVQLQAL